MINIPDWVKKKHTNIVYDPISVNNVKIIKVPVYWDKYNTIFLILMTCGLLKLKHISNAYMVVKIAK